MREIRILLVGKTGSGKSSVGNTILGRNAFEVSHTAGSCTKTCQKEAVYYGSTKYVIVDTPGIYDTNLTTLKQKKELLRIITETEPGFHIIAFVMKRGDKYTEELQETQKRFYKWFGNDVDKHACLILTNTKDGQEQYQYLENPPRDLGILLKRVNGSPAAFENHGTDTEKEKQVHDFLDSVNTIVHHTSEQCFTNLMYHVYKSYKEDRDMDTITEDSFRILSNVEHTDGFPHAMMELEESDSSHRPIRVYEETLESNTIDSFHRSYTNNDNWKSFREHERTISMTSGHLKFYDGDGTPIQQLTAHSDYLKQQEQAISQPIDCLTLDSTGRECPQNNEYQISPSAVNTEHFSEIENDSSLSVSLPSSNNQQLVLGSPSVKDAKLGSKKKTKSRRDRKLVCPDTSPSLCTSSMLDETVREGSSGTYSTSSGLPSNPCLYDYSNDYVSSQSSDIEYNSSTDTKSSSYIDKFLELLRALWYRIKHILRAV